MEGLVRPPQTAEREPLLWLDWMEGQNRGRRGGAWVASLALHLAAMLALALLPRTAIERPRTAGPVRTVTPLVAPPPQLTQADPNRGRIGTEFTVESLLPQPRLQAPPPRPSVARGPARAAEPPKPKPPSPAPLPEPPQVEVGGPLLAQAAPLGALPAPLPQPPQIQPEEKPKLAFETPGAPAGGQKPGGLGSARIAPPSTSVNEAVREAIRAGGGGMVVGDLDLSGAGGGIGGVLVQPTTPGRTGSALELLSDPMGVDFKPYLIRILAMVRRNWMAVIPESARMGRAGRVQIQFAIARDGSVPKLVIAMPSGTDALDRAAVAGISASHPFPPLPAEFRGEQVRLQFTFSYNMR